MRVWIKFAMDGALRYLSHLDTMRMWQRAVRRAALPVAYSQGFNPHPKMSFAMALPVGVISHAQYLDINFTKDIRAADLENLQQVLPAGLTLLGWRIVPAKIPPLMSLVRAACWEQKITDAEAVEKKVAQLLSRTEIMVERKGKKGLKMINLRPFIYDLTIKGQEQKLIMLLAVGNIGSAKPEEVLSLLHLSPNNSLCQTEILLGVGEALQSPLAVCLREKEVSLNAKANYYQLRQ